MAYAYSDLVTRTQQWAEQAQQTGWINSQQLDVLTELDTRTPEILFSAGQARPLMVAFFGGTGVGKSSLINRLAAQKIARTGIERPTSREITLYYHHSVILQQLPENLPLEKIKMAQHDNEKRKNVVWVDMPDMDSTEQKNKQLVLQWLPHIDVLVYVVSPERYRDNKAWRLLLAESARHAWVFVLNQWDRGEEEQYNDFIRQLEKAGFSDPIVKRTVCNADILAQQQDEFKQLEETILQLGEQQTIVHLQQRGAQVRKNELQQKLKTIRQQLGQASIYPSMQEQWHKQWEQTEQLLSQGFDWPIQRLAAAYVTSASHHILEKNSSEGGKESTGIWDDWAQSRLDDVLDEIVLSADQQQLPITPIRNSFALLKTKAGKIVYTQTELAVRQALANPGNRLQRIMLKTSAICATFLPLLAMTWVGFQVFDDYYDSSVSEQAYLGTNFAIHSALLIIISWLIPFFMRKQFKPSMEKVAQHGLKKGLQAGLSTIDIEVASLITENQQQQTITTQSLEKIISACQQTEATTSIENETLSRMLVN